MYTCRLLVWRTQQARFWNDLVISMVGLYENWKRIKNLKLTQELLDKLLKKDIMVEPVPLSVNEVNTLLFGNLLKEKKLEWF